MTSEGVSGLASQRRRTPAVPIHGDHVACSADALDIAVVKEQCAITESRHGVKVVAHKDHSLVLLAHLLERLETLRLKACVADSQHLVEKEDVEWDLDSNRV